jgi:hypothetical protein
MQAVGCRQRVEVKAAPYSPLNGEVRPLLGHSVSNGMQSGPLIGIEKGPRFGIVVRVVPVANRRAPRASRSALMSDEAARVGGCLFAHRGKPGWHSGAVFEAPTLVAGFDDFAVMGQLVEECRRHFGIAEHAGPFGEGQIGPTPCRAAIAKIPSSCPFGSRSISSGSMPPTRSAPLRTAASSRSRTPGQRITPLCGNATIFTVTRSR